MLGDPKNPSTFEIEDCDGLRIHDLHIEVPRYLLCVERSDENVVVGRPLAEPPRATVVARPRVGDWSDEGVRHQNRWSDEVFVARIVGAMREFVARTFGAMKCRPRFTHQRRRETGRTACRPRSDRVRRI